MDCYFRQYWRDTRLSFTGLKSNTHSEKIDQLSLNVKMLEKIWKPDTYFHNGLSSYLHTITRPNKLLRISEHGDITYSMRYIYTFLSSYSMYLFTWNITASWECWIGIIMFQVADLCFQSKIAWGIQIWVQNNQLSATCQWENCQFWP